MIPASTRHRGMTMDERIAPVEDLLRNPLQWVWYRVADAPIRYRALEFCGIRFAWTVGPFMRPRAGWTLSSHFAMTLTLSPYGDWRVTEAKPFEFADSAERWARGLWRDAIDRTRSRPGETACPDTQTD
jgi:hypothetical protein